MSKYTIRELINTNVRMKKRFDCFLVFLNCSCRKVRPRATFYSALQSTLYTLHSTLYTLHFTFYTLHSTLYTLHSTFYTLHSTLHTLLQKEGAVKKTVSCCANLNILFVQLVQAGNIQLHAILYKQWQNTTTKHQVGY